MWEQEIPRQSWPQERGPATILGRAVSWHSTPTTGNLFGGSNHRRTIHMIGMPSKFQSWWTESSKRSEEHTSELQSLTNLVCRLLLEKKNKKKNTTRQTT